MASLDQPVQLPAPLLNEIPPSIANLIAQIDPWVIYHLKQTVLSGIHYENQVYGVINSFVISIFPLRRRFMVVPQALIRRAMDADEVNEDLGNISIGSTGGLHESRNLRTLYPLLKSCYTSRTFCLHSQRAPKLRKLYRILSYTRSCHRLDIFVTIALFA